MSSSEGPSFSDISALSGLRRLLADDAENASVGVCSEHGDHSSGGQAVPPASRTSNFFLSVLNAEPFAPARCETVRENGDHTEGDSISWPIHSKHVRKNRERKSNFFLSVLNAEPFAPARCETVRENGDPTEGDSISWPIQGVVAHASNTMMSDPGFSASYAYTTPYSGIHSQHLTSPDEDYQKQVAQSSIAESSHMATGAYLNQPHVVQPLSLASDSCLVASTSQVPATSHTLSGQWHTHHQAFAENHPMTTAEYLNQPHVKHAFNLARGGPLGTKHGRMTTNDYPNHTQVIHPLNVTRDNTAVAQEGHMTAAEYLNQPHVIRALNLARGT